MIGLLIRMLGILNPVVYYGVKTYPGA